MSQFPGESSKQKQMQRNALSVFLTGAALVFIAAMYFSISTEHMTAFYALLGVCGFLGVMLWMVFRK
ncbi:MAG TPA: hypothetical protein VI112_16340 [Bacteroidia bacterium]|jgi:hypothetical protein